MSTIPFDEAIELLSNQYRRDILRLISIKERYAFELSKILNISQRAVSNHLKALQDAGLVLSEKRKSSKGPDREYFKLNRAVVLSLTIAPNLFLATLRSLDDTPQTHAPIDPGYQLSSANMERDISEVISEGLELLPQIKEGLELIEVQQSKLLRGYQGIRNHLREILEKKGFTTKEIRLLLFLIENDGSMTKEELEFSMGESTESLIDLINGLKSKGIVGTEFFETDKGMSFRTFLTVDTS